LIFENDDTHCNLVHYLEGKESPVFEGLILIAVQEAKLYFLQTLYWPRCPEH